MGGVVSFGSTIWSDIRLAREGDRSALDRIARAYRPPIVRFLQRAGFGNQDAEDLAQEVFVEIVDKDLLKRAEPGAGRFRSLLIGVTKNVIRMHRRRQGAKKRGGEAGASVAADSRVEDSGAVPGDAALFDQLWVMHLLQRAFRRLAKEAESRGNHQDEIVRLALLEKASSSEIAGRLGESEGVVRNLLHRGKLRLLDFVREEIALYAEPGAEMEAEVRDVFRLIGREEKG